MQITYQPHLRRIVSSDTFSTVLSLGELTEHQVHGTDYSYSIGQQMTSCNVVKAT